MWLGLMSGKTPAAMASQTPEIRSCSPQDQRSRHASHASGCLKLTYLLYVFPCHRGMAPYQASKVMDFGSGSALCQISGRSHFLNLMFFYNNFYFLLPLVLLRYCVGMCIETKFLSTSYTNVLFYPYYCWFLIQLLASQDLASRGWEAG